MGKAETRSELALGSGAEGLSTDWPEPSPRYQQVKRMIAARIDSGQWPPRTRVPSENDLAQALGLSRMTVHRALRELTAEGRLFRLQGVGTFVAEPKPQATLLEIRSIAQEIAQWGAVHTCDVLLLAQEPAPEEVATALEVAPGAPVFHSVLVHRSDGRPVQLSDRFVNPAVAPGYLSQDFTRTTPSDYLLSVAPVREIEHIIEAVRPDPRVQALLEMEPGEPCLLLHRRTWTGPHVATASRLYYPGPRYRLGGRFQPGAASPGRLA